MAAGRIACGLSVGATNVRCPNMAFSLEAVSVCSTWISKNDGSKCPPNHPLITDKAKATVPITQARLQREKSFLKSALKKRSRMVQTRRSMQNRHSF